MIFGAKNKITKKAHIENFTIVESYGKVQVYKNGAYQYSTDRNFDDVAESIKSFSKQERSRS
jgi:hypothetical protein